VLPFQGEANAQQIPRAMPHKRLWGDALGWLVYGLWPWLQLCLAAAEEFDEFRAGLRGAQGAFGMAS